MTDTASAAPVAAPAVSAAVPVHSAPPAALPRPPRVPDEALRRSTISRSAWAAAAIAALTATAALVVMLRPSDAWQNVDPPALPHEVTAALPAPAAQPKEVTIRVELRGLPQGAEINVDGAPAVGPTLELARDGRNRVIRVSAPGKAPWQAVHHASASASYDVFMVDSEPEPRSKTTTARSSTATRPKAHKRPPSALRRLDF